MDDIKMDDVHEIASDPADSQENGGTADGAGDENHFQNQYLRLAAELENFKRRKNQELLTRSRYASEEAVIAMLPVLDNLRRALDHTSEDADDTLVVGVRMVVREFEAALARLGVTPIDAVGAPFDPAVHEAIGGEESDDVEDDTVLTELQRGYRLHEKVLRPSVVRIAHPRSTPVGQG